ncbi:Hypothetical predicted protein [Olea europaea subsp. europaea]|uniref:Uncharacterized protein n=1 Tax=Olea europaea subsp. europaea TaxID=158383 RepID=A0A8S0S3U4_OLEEU|nr:Hypothetical predicted protein [Olea europaea subsp. europaea]
MTKPKAINIHGMPERRGKRKHEKSPTKSHMKKSAASSVTLRKVQSKMIVICDLEPLESEMAMPYMNGFQYNKPIQPTSSIESRRRTKRRKERTVEDVGTSGKLVPSVLPLMDSNIGQAHSLDDDDDFVAPPPRRQEPSACGKSLVVEGPTVAYHSQEEPQSHGAQRDDFLSEFVSTMISSAMDEIIRRSGDRTSEHGVRQKEAPGVGDQEHHGAGGSEKAKELENVVSNVDRKGKGKMDPSDDLLFSLEPPSFDLGIEFTPPNVLHSEETHKRVDSIISDVVTTTKTVENEGSPTAEPTSGLPIKRVLRLSRVLQSPFVVGQERGKLFKHDDNVVVLEDYRDNVDEVDKSAFMGKSYRHWMVLEDIESYVKVLPALMNTLGISKKDPDYRGPQAKELKVIIDDTLPQQTNGIFVVLYALYLIRGGRCSIPQKFDASKFRMDIATLLYKHRQVYTKKVNRPTTGEVVVIE